MRQYTAQISSDYENVEYEIEGFANNPQEFHKIILTEHINWPKEEILSIFNSKDKRVFNIKRGFNGT
jgi:hypothetical protein